MKNKWKLSVSTETVKYAMMANVPPRLVERNTQRVMEKVYDTKREAEKDAAWINMWSAYQQGKMGHRLHWCAAKAVKK